MSIEELLQQMEEYRNRRKQADHRPRWLRSFISRVAEVFEPLQYAGRVGFDCQAGEHGWIVSMYLGTTEIIGGPRDGQIDHVSFRVDMTRLSGLFRQIQRMEWYSVSNNNDDRFSDATRSLLSVIGTLEDNQTVQLELLAAPPGTVAAGLKINDLNATGEHSTGSESGDAAGT